MLDQRTLLFFVVYDEFMLQKSHCGYVRAKILSAASPGAKTLRCPYLLEQLGRMEEHLISNSN